MQGSTLGQRLRFLITHSGLNIKKFSEISGIHYRTLQRYLDDSREPSSEALKQIYDCFDISIDWLITGTGSMSRQQLDDFGSDDKELVNLVRQLGVNQRNEIVLRVKEMLRLNQLSEMEARLRRLEEHLKSNDG
jgi:transcriptional regulator with XRE-family HTH domain